LTASGPKALLQALHACDGDYTIPEGLRMTLREVAKEVDKRGPVSPIDKLVSTVARAVKAYDETNDHTRHYASER
jgi:hypothetical protein